jgi:adenylate cyclase
MTAARRLAAILAADVAGYSRMMEADGEGTLERLKALRREVLDQQIAEHHGRIVKTTGDGLLAEFASVVNAVRVAVQQAMPERSAGVAADSRIELRIGINLGGDPEQEILLGVPIALFDRALVLNPSDARCWYARRRE